MSLKRIPIGTITVQFWVQVRKQQTGRKKWAVVLCDKEDFQYRVVEGYESHEEARREAKNLVAKAHFYDFP